MQKVLLNGKEGNQITESCILTSLINVCYDKSNRVIKLDVPAVPPTFLGDIANSYESNLNIPDPITWWYELKVDIPIEVNLDQSSRMNFPIKRLFSISFPITVCSIGLKIIPPFKSKDYWDQQPDSYHPLMPMRVSDHGELKPLSLALVDWRTIPEINPRTLQDLSSKSLLFRSPAVLVREANEDFTVLNSQLLTYSPIYFVNKER
jgi:hypothetical protein